MFSKLESKRVRRDVEPAGKQWHDAALSESGWDEMNIMSDTKFALDNIFFFPKPTSVQAQTVPWLSTPTHSAIVEAPTGSGKTLAFLIPVLERITRCCQDIVTSQDGTPIPLMTRNISAVIVSPNALLAQQTCAVARSLMCRSKLNIKVELADNSAERLEVCLERMSKGSRGACRVLVTTSHDLVRFIKLLTGDSTETPDKVGNKRKRETGSPASNRDLFSSNQVQFRPLPASLTSYQPFLLIVDEADLCLQSKQRRDNLDAFAEFISCGASSSFKFELDIGLFGATVTSSTAPTEFLDRSNSLRTSKLLKITLGSDDQFISQLKNAFMLVQPDELLQSFVSCINAHPSKKHFVFFNSPESLLLVKTILTELGPRGGHSTRPLFQLDSIFSLHEGMKDAARMSQLNSFLLHGTDHSHEDIPQATKNFRKVSSQKMGGSGALLLCTDLVAYGLDIRDVDYVHHFEPPTSVAAYTHRIGRVARMGMKGTSILYLPSGVNCDGFRDALQRCLSGIKLEEIPTVYGAPIASTIRNVISDNPSLRKIAMAAAAKMCMTLHRANTTHEDNSTAFYQFYDLETALRACGLVVEENC